MGTFSARMGLFLAALTDPAAIDKINAALTRVDGAAGLILVADGVRPTTELFPGMYLLEKTSKKKYYLDDSGVMVAGVYTGGVWIQDIGGDVFYGLNDLAEQQFPVTNTGVNGNLGTPNYPADRYETAAVNFTTDGVKSICVEAEWIISVYAIDATSANNALKISIVVDGTVYLVRDTTNYVAAHQALGSTGAANTVGAQRGHRPDSAKIYLTPAAGAHTAKLRIEGGKRNTTGNYGYSGVNDMTLGVTISG